MEAIIKDTKVHNKGCIGSARFKRDIMLTIRTKNDDEFNDFFLTNEEALLLIKQLSEAIQTNLSN